MNPKLKKFLINAAKILVSFALIFWVFSKLNLSEIKAVFVDADWFLIFLALLSFLISLVFSVLRFNLFIRKTGIRLTWKANFKLYLLGMFYNYFLPGGVGGDAYKIIVLKKEFKKSYKKVGQAIFVDRFMGVLAIGFLMFLFGLFIPISQFDFWKYIICVLALCSVFVILQLSIKFFKFSKIRIYLGFLYSIFVQGLQILSIIFIMKSFSILDDYLIFIVMFLVSSILSVVSFAGIGVREAVFFYGASLLNFQEDTSTSIALTFSLIGALVSLFGVFLIFSKINFRE